LVRQQILTGHVVAIDGKTLRGSATATTPASRRRLARRQAVIGKGKGEAPARVAADGRPCVRS
jgi:hypothetical protein